MSFISLSCESLCCDISSAVPAGGLQDMKQIEAQPLQQCVISFDLNPGTVPERIQISDLFAQKLIEGRC